MRSRRDPHGGGLRWSALLAGVVITAAVMPFAPPRAAAADASCTPPQVFPVDELQGGMQATSLTVLQGTTPVAFDLTILGVMPGGYGEGIDLILVKGGALIQQLGGFPAGVSGSPVYIGGKLVGAVSSTFQSDPTIGGVTAAQPMLDLFGYPGGGGTAAAAAASVFDKRVRLTPALRAVAARAAGMPASAFSPTAVPIPVPLGISGLSGHLFSRVQARLARRAPDLAPYQAASTAVPTQATTTLMPGDSLSALDSYGDVTWGGLGTVTAVCGNMVVGWGHYFNGTGASALGLNDAYIVDTIPSADGWEPSKYAYATDPVGTVDQDRMAGVRGIQGSLPAQIPIVTSITAPDLGRSRTGTTVLVDLAMAPDIVRYHVGSNLQMVGDRWGPGTADLTWTIEGTTPAGTPFRLERRDMVYEKEDITWYGPSEITYDVGELLTRQFGTPTISSITATGTVSPQRLMARIVGTASASSLQPTLRDRSRLAVRRGGWVKLRVNLLPTGQQTPVSMNLRMRVPSGARGRAALTLRGGHPSFDRDCSGLGCGTRVPDASYEDLLARLSQTESANQLIASASWPTASLTKSVLGDWIVRGTISIGLVVR